MLALLRGRGQRLRLRMAAQMERLPDRLQRSEPWMVDRFDRAARHSGLVQYFDPVGVRLLPNDLRQMRVERRAVAGAQRHGGEIGIFGELARARRLAETAP